MQSWANRHEDGSLSCMHFGSRRRDVSKSRECLRYYYIRAHVASFEISVISITKFRFENTSTCWKEQAISEVDGDMTKGGLKLLFLEVETSNRPVCILPSQDFRSKTTWNSLCCSRLRMHQILMACNKTTKNNRHVSFSFMLLIYHHLVHLANRSLPQDLPFHAKHFWKVRGGDSLQ
jgi:hypothetical protein